MVAAMQQEIAHPTSKKTITTTDLRNVAIGLTAAIAIVMLAAALSSDSGSVSATALDDAPDKRFAANFVSVAATDGTYGIGESITITVTWSSAVSVTGIPTLNLDNGDAATYFTGSGSTALQFLTTVAEGDSDSSDLAVSSFSGTITADDGSGAAGAASGDLGTVIVDGDTPDITGLSLIHI